VGLLKLHYLEYYVSVKSKNAHPPSPTDKPLYSGQFDAKQGLLVWAFGCRQNVGQWSQATWVLHKESIHEGFLVLLYVKHQCFRCRFDAIDYLLTGYHHGDRRFINWAGFFWSLALVLSGFVSANTVSINVRFSPDDYLKLPVLVMTSCRHYVMISSRTVNKTER